jgi:hypothetical protein
MGGSPLGEVAAHRLVRARAALWAVGIAVLVLVALDRGAPPAAADVWETVKHFAPENIPAPNPPAFPEDTQLGGVSGMAVNRTGAGGVDPGTLYTVGSQLGAWHTARFSPEGEFELGWRKLERCGPEAEGSPPPKCPPVPNASSTGMDVDIDQATGNVYVFSTNEIPNVVRVYKADGTGPIAEFGEPAPASTIAATPTKFHRNPGTGGIAVNDDGVVYLFDEDTNFVHRLMVFKPKTPGVFTEYEYGGEILHGGLGEPVPRSPVLDDAGNFYTREEDTIEEYSPTGTPLCEFKESKSGIKGFTVNPVGGEIFYYNYKDKKVHQLSPCNEQGEFVERDAEGHYIAGEPFNAVPPRSEIDAMAFNPTLAWETGRPAGVLYGGAPEECPAIGSCPAEAQGQSSLGYIFAGPVSHEPEVESESVSKVRPTSATLNAIVNPKGSPTTFVFQYLSVAAYEAAGNAFTGAAEAPLGGGALGSGQQPVLASVSVSGLSPNTEYAYRVKATSAEGSDEGLAQTFRTFSLTAGSFPDGRAYELVTPVQKNGGEVIPAAPNMASCGGECKPGLAGNRFPALVSPGGNSVAYQGQPFIFNEGSLEYDEYVSVRSDSGWQTTSLSPPMVGDAGGAGFQAFGLSDGLGSAIVYARNEALTPEAPSEYTNLFLEQTSNRFGLSPLLTNTNATLHRPPGNGLERLELTYAGSSSDYSRQFFEANDALTSDAEDGGAGEFNLYEWTAGQLHLLNVQPGNAETIPGAAFGSGLFMASPAPAVANFSHTISSDGSRVFWTGADGKTYVRLDGSQTLEIPGPGTCKGSVALGSRTCFLTASADGSEVLLSNGQILRLNQEAQAYESSADLTGGQGGFEGIAGQSGDLSHVYFVDTAVLTGEEENSVGDKPQLGDFNLYSWQSGTPATTRFVTTLLGTDNGTDTSSLGVWTAPPVRRSAEASPDGRWLAFASEAELTGIDSIGSCVFNPKQNKFTDPGPCPEVYLYDSLTGQLSCPSCNPSGAAPLGSSLLRRELHPSASLPQPRYLTNSGRLFFDSRDALSSLDTNNGVEDVYQSEPQGVGSCTHADGCVSLISSGRGAYDANFLAMDPSGDNVFFTTRNQLLPADSDQLIDLYDARVGGGIAEPPPHPPCQSEGCQPLPPPPPVDPTPSSTSAEGPGNVTGKQKKQSKKKSKKHKKHKEKKQNKSKRGNAK